MLVRKLRIEKGWSQETLAEVSGLSVRTIQRTERGGNASLETLNALAAVLETDLASLSKEPDMSPQHIITETERDAVAYARDIKGFYNHLAIYGLAITGMFIVWLLSGANHPWFIWPALGWGIGVASHGFAVFEVLSLFGAGWEKRQVEKRLASRR
jgi:transcriptional regulator with XRE-family HTH domain